MTIQGLLEQTRQGLHVGEKTFKPTPNTRNPAMLQETEDFLRHMIAYKALLQKYEKALAGFLTSLPAGSKVNLPRVWEAVEGTTMCEPVRAELSQAYPYRVGGDYDEELLQDTIDIMRARIDGITRPIDRWLESLRVVKERMKKLESLRMDVDARRRRGHGRFMRTFRRMAASEDRGQEGGMGGIVGSMSYEDLFSSYIQRRERKRTGLEDRDFERERAEEDFARDALNQHRQLEAVQDSFNDQEEMVFEQLSKLCRDSAFFKSYAAASLVVFKDTVQSILVALGPAKCPLPGFHDRDPGDSMERVAELTDLTEALPKAMAIEDGKVKVPMEGRPNPRLRVSEVFRPKGMTAQQALASEGVGKLEGGDESLAASAGVADAAYQGQQEAAPPAFAPKGAFDAIRSAAAGVAH